MVPQMKFLSTEDRQRIHEAALWLLKNIGMQMPSPEAVRIMKKAGAQIEGEDIVKIPAELVEYAVQKAPRRDDIVLYGREKKYDINLAEDAPVLCTMANATHVIDLETTQRHLCTLKDVMDMVRLMDALDNISINGPLALPQDVPHDTADWYALAATLKSTSKHILTGAPGVGFVRDAIRMASLTVASNDAFLARPFITFAILTRPPFQIDRLSLEALIEVSKHGFPVKLSSGPILGMTSPVTIAGTLAQVHAEVLSCLVLSQLVEPGAQIMYTCFARGMDMKTVNVSMSSPECCILRGASTEMGRHIGLPVRVAAFLRDAKILDAQAGLETGTGGLVGAIAADVLDGLQYDMDTLIDFADLVFSDEAMGALKRIAKGLAVNENTLALNVIEEVGHGGSFLSNKHTLQNFRHELWVPRLIERRAWAQWEKDGKKDIENCAREKAKEILASHQPQTLIHEVKGRIDQIVRQARIDYARSI